MRKALLENSEEIKSLEQDKSKSAEEIASNICDEYIHSIQKDNQLKGKYGFTLIVILIVQLIIINVVFILVGCGILNYTQFTINLYVSACILEITALITIIVKYLFSNSKNEVNSMVREYINKDDIKSNYEFIGKG